MLAINSKFDPHCRSLAIYVCIKFRICQQNLLTYYVSRLMTKIEQNLHTWVI